MSLSNCGIFLDGSCVNKSQSAAKVSLSIMRADSLLLNLHYPPVSQKRNTYNQLEAALAFSCSVLATVRFDRVWAEHWSKVGATEPPKQT